MVAFLPPVVRASATASMRCFQSGGSAGPPPAPARPTGLRRRPRWRWPRHSQASPFLDWRRGVRRRLTRRGEATEAQSSEAGLGGIGLVLSREQGDTGTVAELVDRHGSEPSGAAETKAADESDAPRDPNPAAEYLESLHPSVRRSMRRALDRAIAIFTDGAVTKATAFDWSQIDRLQIEKLRSVMVDRDAADGTVNHMLSGVRSTARIAWDHGLVIDKTRTAFKDEPNEKPQQRRRAGRYVQTGRGSAVVRGDRYRSYWCS